MTAHDQMRAMLDQLMGTGRNGTYVISLFASLRRHAARGVSDRYRVRVRIEERETAAMFVNNVALYPLYTCLPDI